MFTGEMDRFAELQDEIVERFRSFRAVPVITADAPDYAEQLAAVLTEEKFPVAEVTFRAGRADEMIRSMLDSKPEMLVGAGTVLTLRQAESARRAGAKFMVSPGFNPKVAEYCRAAEIPYIPGIATATELQQAAEMGYRAVKFFPAETLGGVKTIQALSAPYPDMFFMPTGGVKLSNISEYLAFDHIFAVGGSWMVPKAQLAAGNFDVIRENLRETSRVLSEIHND